MTPEERHLARSVHVRPAADGHHYDAVSAAIADRDELLAVLTAIRNYDTSPDCADCEAMRDLADQGMGRVPEYADTITVIPCAEVH